MIFEGLPTVPQAEELIDQAFSRAARAGGAKSGREAQQSMLLTASNVLSDNLDNVVTAWPDFETIHPFYRELADAILRRQFPDRTAAGSGAGIDTLRAALSEISWAGRKTHELGREYQGRLPGDADGARALRKQAFARMADVVREVEDDLKVVGTARDALRDLPEVRPEEPTIVVAGYPNVGKSSFVNAVTRASVETAEYPFTTRGVNLGHVEIDRIRYQVVDTPGLLDRPAAERNEIEEQAAAALPHVADIVLVLVDPSITCGYPLDDQIALRDDIAASFDGPVMTVATKADLSTAVDAEYYTCLVDGDTTTTDPDLVTAPDAVLKAAIELIDYEPTLPFEE